jgi:hypothetical protein
VVRDRGLSLRHDAVDQAQEVVGLEGVLQGSELIQQAAQTPHVTLFVVARGFARHDLRGQEVRRAHDRLRGVDRVLQHPRHAEVAEAAHVHTAEKHVLARHVPVQYLAPVHVREGEGELREPVQDLLLREEAARLARGLDLLREIPVAAVLHHDVQVAVLDERVVVPHDARVHQALQEHNLLLRLAALVVRHVRQRHALHDKQVALLVIRVSADGLGQPEVSDQDGLPIVAAPESADDLEVIHSSTLDSSVRCGRHKADSRFSHCSDLRMWTTAARVSGFPRRCTHRGGRAPSSVQSLALPWRG